MLQRADFHKKFKSPGPVILPVIHVLDDLQTAANIDHIIDAGLNGCFLINHDFGIESFLPVLEAIRGRYPDFWIGVNFLAVTGLKAFPILADLGSRGVRIDAYWADDARIEESAVIQEEADTLPQRVRPVAGKDCISAALPSRNSVRSTQKTMQKQPTSPVALWTS